jgi:acetyltransferase
VKKNITNDVFYPRTIALIGVSANTPWTHTLSDFQGKVYGVNPHPQEDLGIEVYPSLFDINDEIDQAIVMVPNKIVPQVLEDCGKKGVKVVSIFTSGFSEIQTEEGRLLEAKIKEIAERFGIILIGPNCIGAHNSRTGLNFTMEELIRHEGNVALISQSGGLAQNFTIVGRRYGVEVLKAISCGNSALYEPADFLDFFKDDKEIDLVTMYVEGAKDGRKLLKSLQEANKRKPVIMWKAGKTAEGSRAAGTHTAALTGAANIWEAAMKQSKVVKADSFLDLVYTAMTFDHARLNGRNIAIICISGGQGVEYTDILSSAGLEIPVLSNETQREIESIMPQVGVNTRNPLDMALSWRTVEMINGVINSLSKDQNINGIVISMDAHREKMNELTEEGRIKKLTNAIIEVRNAINIPVFVILTATDVEEIALNIFDDFVKAKIPVYRDPTMAANCIKKLADCWFWRES